MNDIMQDDSSDGTGFNESCSIGAINPANVSHEITRFK